MKRKIFTKTLSIDRRLSSALAKSKRITVKRLKRVRGKKRIRLRLGKIEDREARR